MDTIKVTDCMHVYLSHCPMQGPQALARTTPPTSLRILDYRMRQKRKRTYNLASTVRASAIVVTATLNFTGVTVEIHEADFPPSILCLFKYITSQSFSIYSQSISLF